LQLPGIVLLSVHNWLHKQYKIDYQIVAFTANAQYQ